MTPTKYAPVSNLSNLVAPHNNNSPNAIQNGVITTLV
jgi:hypothetical protein